MKATRTMSTTLMAGDILTATTMECRPANAG
jgi:hypothetical protein